MAMYSEKVMLLIITWMYISLSLSKCVCVCVCVLRESVRCLYMWRVLITCEF